MKNIFFFLICFLFISVFCFAQTSSSTIIYGITPIGSYVPVLLDNSGKIKTTLPAAFTDGSNDTSALVDSENAVYVNLRRNTIPKAIKTTTNTIASTTPQTILPIANAQSITIVLNDINKELWVKVGGADAGLDSGVVVYHIITIDNLATDTVISYWASEPIRIAIIQE